MMSAALRASSAMSLSASLMAAGSAVPRARSVRTTRAFTRIAESG